MSDIRVSPTEVMVGIEDLIGFSGEYVRFAAGPILNRDNEFIAVISVRRRDASHEWVNIFDHYAVRFNIGCTELHYKKPIDPDKEFSDSQSSLSAYYDKDGKSWGFYGAHIRDQATGAYLPYIINTKFTD